MISNFSKFVDYKKCFFVLDQLPYLAFLLMTEFLPCSALNALSATCSTMLDRLTTSGAWGGRSSACRGCSACCCQYVGRNKKKTLKELCFSHQS